MQWKFLGRVFYLSKTMICTFALLLGTVLVIGGYFLLPKETTFPAESTDLHTDATLIGTPQQTPTTATPTPALWRIYVVGAVKEPGLYTVTEGSLVYDAVLAAGGLLPEANTDTINLAQELEPNFMVRILTERQRLAQGRESSLVLIKNNVEVSGSQVQSGAGTTAAEGDTAKININSATKEALMTLSGIGEARAESIIAYREENGPFQTIEDIMLVSGIKESAFAKIKDRITT